MHRQYAYTVMQNGKEVRDEILPEEPGLTQVNIP